MLPEHRLNQRTFGLRNQTIEHPAGKSMNLTKIGTSPLRTGGQGRCYAYMRCPGPFKVRVRVDDYSARCVIVRVLAPEAPWIGRCYENCRVETLQFLQGG